MAPDTVASRYERELMARHVFAYDWALANVVSPGDHLLEIGCGEGYGSAMLAGKAAEVTALDADREAIEHASHKYAGRNMTFMTHTGEELPFPDSSFDSAVCFQVLEHLQDPASLAREAARVLKPGGVLCLTTPNRVHRLKEGQKPWYKFHVREFSAFELSALLAPHFSVCGLRYLSVPDEHFRMEMRVARLATLLQRFDPFQLRDLVPYWAKQFVFGLISGKKQEGPEPAGPVFSVSDTDVNGLDLLVVCRKGKV